MSREPDRPDLSRTERRRQQRLRRRRRRTIVVSALTIGLSLAGAVVVGLGFADRQPEVRVDDLPSPDTTAPDPGRESAAPVGSEDARRSAGADVDAPADTRQDRTTGPAPDGGERERTSSSPEDTPTGSHDDRPSSRPTHPPPSTDEPSPPEPSSPDPDPTPGPTPGPEPPDGGDDDHDGHGPGYDDGRYR